MSETKQETITKFKTHEKDTGSAEVQIALMSQRIEFLTGHFKMHQHDNQSRRGLLQMVGHRRRLLAYLKTKNLESYQKVTKELGLRK